MNLWLMFAISALVSFLLGFILAAGMFLAEEPSLPVGHQPAADSIARLSDRIVKYKKCVALLFVLLVSVGSAAIWRIWL